MTLPRCLVQGSVPACALDPTRSSLPPRCPPPPCRCARVRLLLEHSAALGIEGGQEPLQRRLAGLPLPVAACLGAALAELPPEAPDIK